MAAGVVERTQDEDGATAYASTVDLPQDFALDQPLSPFLLAALDILELESETYALDLISLVEATLEDPRQVLRAQERAARAEAVAEMKAAGVDYEERIERAREVTYPKPLVDVIEFAFSKYCESVPWARDFTPSPKSILRDMVETASDFKSYVGRYGIARSEGTLLRYLSDAFRVLDRTVPRDRFDERLSDIVAWLDFVVHTIDSSLVDEWEMAGAGAAGAEGAAAPGERDAVVQDRHGLTVLVRNALFRRVQLAAQRRAKDLGALDAEVGYSAHRWQALLDELFVAHDEIETDADARSMDYLAIDESPERDERIWRVLQTFKDSDGDRDFVISADVDLVATQETGEVVFSRYRAGFVEDVLEGLASSAAPDGGFADNRE